jgi:hypothetical protein
MPLQQHGSSTRALEDDDYRRRELRLHGCHLLENAEWYTPTIVTPEFTSI